MGPVLFVNSARRLNGNLGGSKKEKVVPTRQSTRPGISPVGFWSALVDPAGYFFRYIAHLFQVAMAAFLDLCPPLNILT